MSTICAISTPAGTGGIAVVRVSGPDAIGTVSRLWRGKPLSKCDSHTAHLGQLVDPGRDSEPLDQAVATIFRGPNSFTGEDVVELSVHGSRFVQAELIRLLCGNGARLAEPGEFTRRAFAAGKMDLAQAEAVADVIAANSRAAL
ncbi:MAG: tRNA uridine-5-carboxymethylaminomethyl(34) synthesis GTPase MnmE, partial [Muribaculaceae bacterium]|nr:tRNA uridine-5-carboxymethylaminomethyl(34) synthesis GTPase MnmE [Muribaculaceae bacterium]